MDEQLRKINREKEKRDVSMYESDISTQFPFCSFSLL